MNRLPPRRREIAMMFQFYALYPALTVRENIMIPLPYDRLEVAVANRRIAEMVDLLHLFVPQPAPSAQTVTGLAELIEPIGRGSAGPSANARWA